MIIGIIPARFDSTRFPGKPLAMIGGKSMITRVYEQMKKAEVFDEICVATDNERIAQHIEEYGGMWAMTSPSHQSGTSRCAEVAAKYHPNSIIINVQGDEPFIHPEQIRQLSELSQKPGVKIATLIKAVENYEDLFNQGVVKVITDKNGKAIYFSRQVIPFLRDVDKENWISRYAFCKHIGLYAYRAETLAEISALPPSPLSEAEKLEQLNWLENSYEIHTALSYCESIAVDTPEDLEKAVEFYNSKWQKG